MGLSYRSNMIRKTLTAENFDGDPVKMIAYFNLNKKELMDLIYSELSTDKPNGMMRQMLSSESSDREYMRSVSGIEAYRFFTRVVDAAYGVRDEDGVHFRKSPELLDDFRSSVFYEDFIFSLAEDAEKAATFINGVFPKSLVEKAKQEGILS